MKFVRKFFFTGLPSPFLLLFFFFLFLRIPFFLDSLAFFVVSRWLKKKKLFSNILEKISLVIKNHNVVSCN